MVAYESQTCRIKFLLHMRFRPPPRRQKNDFESRVTWRWKEVWRDDTEAREVLL